MTIYIFIFFYLTLHALFIKLAYYRKNDLNKNTYSKLPAPLLFSLVFSLIISFVLGVRDNVGTDFKNYKSYFENIENMYSLSVEPGYNLLNITVTNAGFGFWLVLFISSFIPFSLIFFRIFRDSLLPWLSIIIIFGLSIIFQATNHVRFVFVIGLIFFASKYVAERAWFKWLIAILFAFLFHYSAIIYAPLYLDSTYLINGNFIFKTMEIIF